MRSRLALAAALAAFVVPSTLPSVAQPELIYGVTNLQTLVRFDSNTRVATPVPLTGFGLTANTLVSIDYRPATGQLYGLTNQGGLFTINTTTGVGTQVGSTLALTGGLKAIDFNPTVDLLRVITSSGVNLRVNPNTGAIVSTDPNLAFAAGDSNAGDVPAVVNGAYTNSFAGATSTTLYDLDATNDVLATQAPANAGTLNTVGAVGFDLVNSAGFTGFDISGSTGVAYLVGNKLGTGGLVGNSLYSVNLATGAASLLGPVTGSGGLFRDIAVVVPEPTSLAILGAAAVPALRRRRR